MSGKKESVSAVLARIDQRLQHIEQKQEELGVTVQDLSDWKAGVKGGWSVVVILSSLAAFVVGVVLTIIFH